jgi:heme exporter protein C
MNWVWFHRFGSPPYFYRFAGRWAPWFLSISIVLLLIGLYGGLFVAPVDYYQSEVFRVMYVHVPSAYLSLMTYTWMAIAAAIGLIWRIKICHAIAAACAPAGAMFTAVSLATGMIWGQPTWGTYWLWDPRLVSQLFVLFFFLGYLALRGAIDDRDRADRSSAVLAVVGVINVPIVHYSVEWWNSLHQPPTLSKGAMPMSMAWPLLVMIAAYTFFFLAIMLMRARAEVLRRERSGAWVRDALASGEAAS